MAHHCPFSQWPWDQDPIVPGAIAKLTTLNGGETCRKGAEQHRGCHPQGKGGRSSAGVIDRLLRLGNDVAHPLFGVGLREPRAGRDHPGEVTSIRSAHVAGIPKAGAQKPGYFSPRRAGPRSRPSRSRCGHVRSKELVGGDIRRAHHCAACELPPPAHRQPRSPSAWSRLPERTR